jgi:hypothetical protein
MVYVRRWFTRGFQERMWDVRKSETRMTEHCDEIIKFLSERFNELNP